VNFIKYNYGSYSGYVSHLLATCNAVLGRYTFATEVDWRRVNRFVFVCKGNVCRSPYAAAKALSLGLDSTSFGLSTSGGIPADAAAVRAAKLRHLDLSPHRSAQFDPSHLRSGDLVLAFEPHHVDTLRKLAPMKSLQFSLVGLWPWRALRPMIADPFGKCDEYFDSCFNRIDSAVNELLAHS
jgi:protein-tyrosine phosphatase